MVTNMMSWTTKALMDFQWLRTYWTHNKKKIFALKLWRQVSTWHKYFKTMVPHFTSLCHVTVILHVMRSSQRPTFESSSSQRSGGWERLSDSSGQIQWVCDWTHFYFIFTHHRRKGPGVKNNTIDGSFPCVCVSEPVTHHLCCEFEKNARFILFNDIVIIHKVERQREKQIHKTSTNKKIYLRWRRNGSGMPA